MVRNGYLPTSSLSALVNFHPVERGAGGLALPVVAHQWAVMAADCEHDTKVRLDAGEGYRDYDRQVQLKAAQNAGSGVLAAVPGYSNHGLGVAIDAESGVGTPSTPNGAWVRAHAALYGFVQDVGGEFWHLHYTGNPRLTAPSHPTAVVTPKPAVPVQNGIEMLIPALIKNGSNVQLVAYNDVKNLFVPTTTVENAALVKLTGKARVTLSPAERDAILAVGKL